MNQDNKMLEPLLDAKQVKAILRCSLPLVYKMAARGQLPCVQWECSGAVNKRSRTMIRFKKTDIIKFMELNSVKSSLREDNLCPEKLRLLKHQTAGE
jgi:hypothetical protein